MTHSPRTQAQDRWLRWYNDIVYSRLPGVYNALDVLTFGAWWSLVRRALDYVPVGGRVLEVGFGPGRLHVELVRRADVGSGLDLARGMCRFTQRRVRRAGLVDRVVQGSVLELPYAGARFDTVVSTFAFSGFPQGEVAMQEMSRVLCPGGCVVLVDIGLPTDGNPLGTFLARLWERMGDTLYDYASLMEAAGLTVETRDSFGPGGHIHVIVGQRIDRLQPS